MQIICLIGSLMTSIHAQDENVTSSFAPTTSTLSLSKPHAIDQELLPPYETRHQIYFYQKGQHETSLKELNAAYQILFREHVRKHQHLIHPDNKDQQEAFKKMLADFITDLRFWVREAMLLRPDPDRGNEYVINSLPGLPHHYLYLIILADPENQSTFGELLEIIKGIWEETIPSYDLNLYTQQLYALTVIWHDLNQITKEYEAKLPGIRYNEKALAPTLDLLIKVKAFTEKYGDLILQLISERQNFIGLCSCLFPKPTESLETLNQIFDDLINKYKYAQSIIRAPLPLQEATPFTILQADESSLKEYRRKKSGFFSFLNHHKKNQGRREEENKVREGKINRNDNSSSPSPRRLFKRNASDDGGLRRIQRKIPPLPLTNDGSDIGIHSPESKSRIITQAPRGDKNRDHFTRDMPHPFQDEDAHTLELRRPESA